MKRLIVPLALGFFLAVAFSFGFGIDTAFGQSEAPIQLSQGIVQWDQFVEVKINWSVITTTVGITPTVIIGSRGVIEAQPGCTSLDEVNRNLVSCDYRVSSVRIKVQSGARLMYITLYTPDERKPFYYITNSVIPTGVNTQYQAGNQIVPIGCLFDLDYTWKCDLPTGSLVINPPFELVSIWSILQQPQPLKIYRKPSLQFVATYTPIGGETMNITCRIPQRGVRAWDIQCPLGSETSFVVDFWVE